MNDIVNEYSLTAFFAVIFTEFTLIDWMGVPEITPVELFSTRPIGREPEMIEYEGLDPVVDGVQVKASLRGIVNDDWG